MSDAESYFANLKVADRILGRCVDQIRNSPCAHNTTLIVSSDHSWRASKLYDNKADYRVPLIVHFAGQSRRTDLGPMVHTVNTRKLISEIIAKDTVINADLGKNILSVKISE
jgi:membrane-anchored protein YejM (alkaline phosphatase superfamily)